MQNPDVPSSGNTPSQSLYERICIHTAGTFNMYCLLAKHVKSAPYLLRSFRLFIRNGPNISTPQLVNGGPSNFLSLGRSAIFSSPGFHLSHWHLTHFSIRFLTIILHQTTQKPLLLISFIVSPLPPCAIFFFFLMCTLQSVWGCCHRCQVILDEHH